MKAQPPFVLLLATLLLAAPARLCSQTPRPPLVPTPVPRPATPSLLSTPAPRLPGAAGLGAPKPVEGPFASLLTGDWALSEHGGLPFALYAAKDLNAGQKYPLLLALHGKSQNNENGKQVTGWMKSFVRPERYQANPCIIVAPLCYQPFGGTGAGWGDKPGEQTLLLVRALMKALPVDPKRIYIVGHSMGGFGVCHLMARDPLLFAAGVPVSGYGGAAEEAKLVRKPLWLFHAADDNVVPVAGARDFAKLFGRSKTFKYTEYPEGGHGIPGKVFDDEELYKWLFSQGVHAEPVSSLPPRPL